MLEDRLSANLNKKYRGPKSFQIATPGVPGENPLAPRVLTVMARTPKKKGTMVWEAQPKQAEFLRAEEDEVFYGGAAGGGKSESLLVFSILRRQAIPKSRGLFLRRTFPELERSAIERSRELLTGTGAKYKENKHVWVFPNGSVLEFGYMDQEKDCHKYQSAEYDDICFDEASHFTEYQFKYMLSRCRTTKPGVKPLIRLASNPGNVGHAWLKERYVKVAMNRTYTDEEGRTRRFIPARVWDNKYIVENDPGYVARLKELPENDRRALLEGDWDVFYGQVFTEWNPDIHTCEPFEIPSTWVRARFFDWGYSKPFAVLWAAVDFDGRMWVYREWYGCSDPVNSPDVGMRLSAGEVAQGIARIEKEAGESIWLGYADPSIWNKDPTSGRSVADEMMLYGVNFRKGNNDRLNGKQQVHSRLRVRADGKPGLIVFKTCENLIRTLPNLTYDPVKVEDVDTRLEDHCLTGDTPVETANGPVPIADLVGTEGLVWSHDGFLHCYHSVRCTGRRVPVFEVKFTDGRRVQATAGHPFLLQEGCWVITASLKPKDKVLDIGHWIRYNALQEAMSCARCGRKSYSPGVPGSPVLPLREVFPAQRAALAPGSLGNVQWVGAEGIPCASYRWRPNQQPDRKLGVGSKGVSYTLPYWPAGIQSGQTRAYVAADDTESGRMAPLRGRPGLAQGAWQAGMGKEETGFSDMSDLRQDVCDLFSEPGEVLWRSLQAKSHTAQAAEVESVRPAGLADVFNMEVKDTHSFAVAGGLIVHNCYDALRYGCSAFPVIPEPEKPKKPGLPWPLVTEDTGERDYHDW